MSRTSDWLTRNQTRGGASAPSGSRTGQWLAQQGRDMAWSGDQAPQPARGSAPVGDAALGVPSSGTQVAAKEQGGTVKKKPAGTTAKTVGKTAVKPAQPAVSPDYAALADIPVPTPAPVKQAVKAQPVGAGLRARPSSAPAKAAKDGPGQSPAPTQGINRQRPKSAVQDDYASLKELARAYYIPGTGRTSRQTPGFESRLADTLSGAGKTYGGSLAGFGGLSAELLEALDRNAAQSSPSGQRARQEAENIRRYQTMLDNNMWANGTPLTAEDREKIAGYIQSAQRFIDTEQARQDAVHAPIRKAAESAYGAAARLTESGQRDIDRAKDGLNGLGRFAVDVGVAGAQMGLDFAPSILTGGGSALVPMFFRSAGGGALAGKDSGADLATRTAYALGSGALSVATEQISNIAGPFRKMFGAGAADRIAARLVERFGENGAVQVLNRLSQTAAGRTALAAFGEGFEELVESYFQAPLQRATINPDAKFNPVEAGYEFLIGAALGGLGGGVDVLRRGSAQTAANETESRLDSRQAQPKGTDTPADSGASERISDPLAEAIRRGGRLTDTPVDMQKEFERFIIRKDGAETAPKAEASPDLLSALLPQGKRVSLQDLSAGQLSAVEAANAQGTVDVGAKQQAYQVNPEEHIDRRKSYDMGRKSVNAFQFDHPQLHEFYRGAAEALLNDLAQTQKGGELIRAEGDYYGGRRLSRFTSPAIEALLDEYGLSYGQIEKALNAIIQDKGQENYAAAKRVELVLDDMLSNGFKDVEGRPYGPDEAYIAAKAEIAVSLEAETEAAPQPDLGVMGQEIQKHFGKKNGGPEAAPQSFLMDFAELHRRILEAQAKGESALTEAPAQAEAQTEGPVQVGRVTIIQRPYQGPKPVQAPKNAAPVLVDQSSVEQARNRIEGARQIADGPLAAGRGFKAVLKDFMRGFFSAAQNVEVGGVTFEGAPYLININNSVLGKVISGADLSAERLSLLNILPDVVRNGEYVGSSEYVAHGKKTKPVSRYDYFETPVQIDGQDYIAKFDVEALPDVNNFRTHQIVKIDLVQTEGRLARKSHAPASEKPGPVDGRSALNTDFTIAQGAESVNPADSQMDGLGAADAGFDPISALENKYDVLPEGENPVRPDDMPARTTDDSKVSLLARTIKGAGVVPDSFIPVLEQAVLDGKFSYIPHTNAEAAAKARTDIEYKGWQKALADFHSDVVQGKAGDTITAMGVELANNAVNAGDITTALDIFIDLQRTVRNAGQAAQAVRMLKQATPGHRLYMIQKSVQSMVDAMNLPEGSVKLDNALLKNYLDARTEAERDKVIGEIQQSVADQLPASLLDKWTALRYVNMLGNFRTQGRNILGNTGMMGVRAVKDRLAYVLEAVYHKINPEAPRTKTFTADKALKNAARADYENVKDVALGEGKYQEGLSDDAFSRGVQDKRTIFKMKWLEGYRKLTNWAMTEGDVLFTRHTYARALAGYLQINGVTAAQFTDPAWQGSHTEFVDRARMYAVREAQEATFRDNNFFSDWVSSIGRRANTPKAVRMAAEGLAPFRKTPANVLVRAEEYSLLGIANTIYEAVQAKKGNASSADVINSLAKTLTGSGLFAAGMLLAGGLLPGIKLRGGDDDDDGQRAFDSLTGHQAYSLELDNGFSVTLDWLTPGSMPLFMGVELQKLIEDGDLQAKDLEAALTSIAEPMLQMSMLQGVNDTLDDLKYSNDNLGQLSITLALDYLTQGLTNTLLGQAERTAEPVRQMTYTDKENPIPVWLQRMIGKASAKTPGLDFHQIPYIDEWGREESSGSAAGRLAENFFSPGFFSQIQTGNLERELQRLADATGETSVYPSRVDKSFMVDGAMKYLTADEYTRYARTVGKTRYDILSSLLQHEGYRKLSDADKAKTIAAVYAYATEVGKMEVSSYRPGETTMELFNSPFGPDPATFFLYKRMMAIEDAKQQTGAQANAKVREALYRDSTLTPQEKNLLDDWIIHDMTIIPQDKDVDYSNQDSFAVSQMSDSAVRRWESVHEAFPELSGEDYKTAWEICQRRGTIAKPYTQERKQRDLMEALGLSQRDAWRLIQAVKG